MPGTFRVTSGTQSSLGLGVHWIFDQDHLKQFNDTIIVEKNPAAPFLHSVTVCLGLKPKMSSINLDMSVLLIMSWPWVVWS